MLCCPHCSRLSTMVNNILIRHPASTILFNVVVLLTTVNNVGSTTLFNPVELQAHDFLPCRTHQPKKASSINNLLHINRHFCIKISVNFTCLAELAFELNKSIPSRSILYLVNDGLLKQVWTTNSIARLIQDRFN